MIENDLWKLESKSIPSLDAGVFHLVVQNKSGWAPFLMRRRAGANHASAPILVTSGVRHSVKDAMTDAKKVLAHLMAAQDRGEQRPANDAHPNASKQLVHIHPLLRVVGP